jgi:hypothetical protein
MIIRAAIGNRNRRPGENSGKKRVRKKATMIKAEAKPMPPKRGMSPVWIFLASILSYQAFL